MQIPESGSILYRCATILLAVLLLTACAPENITPVDDNDFQWYLPGYLHEASGLALGLPGLLVHDDELGFVYVIADDFTEVQRVAQLGDPVLSADFEGIAISGNTLYLMDSEGYLYIAEDVQFGPQTVVSKVIRQQTGLGQHCELEGLEYQAGLLLIPCKSPLNDEYRGRMTVFSFDPVTGVAGEFIHVLLDEDQASAFALTAIANRGDDYFLLTTSHLVIVNPIAETSNLIPLNRSLHPQPEGIAVYPDGRIAIVDDRRTGTGRISRYISLKHLAQMNSTPAN